VSTDRALGVVRTSSVFSSNGKKSIAFTVVLIFVFSLTLLKLFFKYKASEYGALGVVQTSSVFSSNGKKVLISKK